MTSYSYWRCIYPQPESGVVLLLLLMLTSMSLLLGGGVLGGTPGPAPSPCSDLTLLSQYELFSLPGLQHGGDEAGGEGEKEAPGPGSAPAARLLLAPGLLPLAVPAGVPPPQTQAPLHTQVDISSNHVVIVYYHAFQSIIASAENMHPCCPHLDGAPAPCAPLRLLRPVCLRCLGRASAGMSAGAWPRVLATRTGDL